MQYPEFKGATVTVVRDPELMKPGFKDPRGIKAKEFHGEMRFIRHIRDADLLSKIGHSDAMGIIADKNYCAGGERSCKKVLDRYFTLLNAHTFQVRKWCVCVCVCMI